MPSDRTVMRMARDALKYHQEQTRPIHDTTRVIAALDAQLAAPVVQPEPVAFIWEGHLGDKTRSLRWSKPTQWDYAEAVTPLYAAPPAPIAPAEPSDRERRLREALVKMLDMHHEGSVGPLRPAVEGYVEATVQAAEALLKETQ